MNFKCSLGVVAALQQSGPVDQIRVGVKLVYSVETMRVSTAVAVSFSADQNGIRVTLASMPKAV